MDSIDDLDVLQIAKALGDPTRFFIYKHIMELNEMRCGDICIDTPVRASTVSHHLKVLVEAGLVDSRREGQSVYYRVIPERLKAYMGYLQKLARHRDFQRKASIGPTSNTRTKIVGHLR